MHLWSSSGTGLHYRGLHDRICALRGKSEHDDADRVPSRSGSRSRRSIPNIFLRLHLRKTDQIRSFFPLDAGILSLSEIVIADLVPLKERGIFLGYLGATWAMASALGPPIGGALSEHACKTRCPFIRSYSLIPVLIHFSPPPSPASPPQTHLSPLFYPLSLALPLLLEHTPLPHRPHLRPPLPQTPHPQRIPPRETRPDGLHRERDPDRGEHVDNLGAYVGRGHVCLVVVQDCGSACVGGLGDGRGVVV